MLKSFALGTLTAVMLTISNPLQAQTADIVDTAVAAGSFKTLAKALEAADLIGTLKGAGPFTVFAPTDEAFAKVPKATLDALAADKAKLKAVLTYHVEMCIRDRLVPDPITRDRQVAVRCVVARGHAPGRQIRLDGPAWRGQQRTNDQAPPW